MCVGMVELSIPEMFVGVGFDVKVVIVVFQGKKKKKKKKKFSTKK